MNWVPLTSRDHRINVNVDAIEMWYGTMSEGRPVTCICLSSGRELEVDENAGRVTEIIYSPRGAWQ